MEVADVIYGSSGELEPVLQELIGTETMQRQKRLHQMGAWCFLYPECRHKRYEHSVGAMLLLRRFGADLKEQVAGLLHDASHTAFCHVVDHLFEAREEDYTESFMKRFVTGGDVARILVRHGFHPEEIIALEQFPLLEQPRPDLCADRIDNSLRDGLAGRWITPKDAQRFLDDFIVEQGRFVFQTRETAHHYARLWIQLDAWYANHKGVASYCILADAMKQAIDAGDLTMEDLFTDDAVVMERLRASVDPNVARLVNYLDQGYEVVEDTENHDYILHRKIRVVDPHVLGVGRLSTVHQPFAEELQKHLERRAVPARARIVAI